MIHVEQHGPVTAIRMARSLIGRPLHWTAAYWVDGLLIDTGPDCTAPELVRVLERVHVDQIVITHAHEDTIGGLALLKKHYPRAQVVAAPRAIPLLQQPDDLRLHFYRRVLWGLPHPINDVVSLDEVNNCITTPDYRLRVLETPGHTLDHVSLFEPKRRWIFCGDAFIGGEDKAWSPEFNMFGIVSSLRTIASLRPERLFPGSGNVRRTPQPELHQKIGSLIRLCREVAKLEAFGLTVAEIVVCLFKEEPRLTFWTQGHLSVANLIEACRSYNAIFAPTHAGEWQDEVPPSIDPPQPKRPSTPQDSSGKPKDQSDFVH